MLWIILYKSIKYDAVVFSTVCNTELYAAQKMCINIGRKSTVGQDPGGVPAHLFASWMPLSKPLMLSGLQFTLCKVVGMGQTISKALEVYEK